MMTKTYRVDWLNDDNPNIIEVKHYNENKSAAMAFARRKSMETDCYVIENDGDRDVAQWLYWAGYTEGRDEG